MCIRDSPDTAVDNHGAVCTADAADTAAEQNHDILPAGNVDTGSISCCGVMTDRLYVQTQLSLFEEQASQNGDDNAQIDKGAVREDELTHDRDIAQTGNVDVVHLRGDTLRQLERAVLRGTEHVDTDEVCQTNTEDGEGQTGYVLIGQEGDGQDSVNAVSYTHLKRNKRLQQQTIV